MKMNVAIAAIVGVILGVIVELFFAFVEQIPLLGCLFALVALLLGLGLPILIGAMAVAFAPSRGLASPLDGALAAVLAELVSRLIGFCASLGVARSFFFGPRFLLPGIEPATRTLFSGIWSLGWLVISLIVAALLGALGGFLYAARIRR